MVEVLWLMLVEVGEVEESGVQRVMFMWEARSVCVLFSSLVTFLEKKHL